MKPKSAYKVMAAVFVVLLVIISFIAVFISNNLNSSDDFDSVMYMGVGQVYEYPKENDKMRFRSYDKNVVSVDKDGIITAVNKGSVKIAAGLKRIYVHVIDAPQSVELNEGAFSMGVGEEFLLSPHVPYSEFNTDFKYSVNGDEAITIDKSGKITAVAAGKVTVTVSTYNDCTASCDIVVGNAPEEISFDASSKTIYMGTTGKLFIKMAAGSASKSTTIQSDNEEVLTVNSKCEITPVAAGTANVIATTYNGKTASCTVTVSDKPYYIRTDLDENKPMIAFTFDDGPNAESTGRILDAFEANNASATFFIVGNRTDRDANADCVRRMVEKGFQLGNHTYDHMHYGSDVVVEDITKCSDVLNEISGQRPSAFRPTGGYLSDIIRTNCDGPIILWSVDTEDWKKRDGEKICDRILESARDGDIVLMHDIYESTADAIERVIPKLMEEGYQIVNVAELAYYKGKTLENGMVYHSIR